jgi:hypothetical protein
VVSVVCTFAKGKELMFHSTRCVSGILAAMLVAVMTCAARADTLYLLDNFNSTTVSDSYPDKGMNQELATRQSGTLAPIQYSVGSAQVWSHQVNNPSQPGMMYMYTDDTVPERSTWVAPNQNFTQDISLSATIVPYVGSQTSGQAWLALGMRGQAPATWGGNEVVANNAYPNTGAWILVKATGAWEYWENGESYNTGGSVSAAASYDVVMTALGNSLTASINGATLDLNGALSGTARTLTGLAAGGSSNYVGVCANSNATYAVEYTLDNLRIAGVPEPNTLVLLAMGLLGLLAYAWRKRK